MNSLSRQDIDGACCRLPPSARGRDHAGHDPHHHRERRPIRFRQGALDRASDHRNPHDDRKGARAGDPTSRPSWIRARSMATPPRLRQSTASSIKPSSRWSPPRDRGARHDQAAARDPPGASPRQPPHSRGDEELRADNRARAGRWSVRGELQRCCDASRCHRLQCRGRGRCRAQQPRRQLRLGMASDADRADRRIAGGRARLLDDSAPGRRAVGSHRRRDAPARRRRPCGRYLGLADGGRDRTDDARRRAFQGKLGASATPAGRASRGASSRGRSAQPANCRARRGVRSGRRGRDQEAWLPPPTR